VARVPYTPSLAENNVRKGFLEHSVYQRLRDELPDYLRLLFMVAYHTGARRGELTRIQWHQVDFTSNRIALNPGETKNGEPRTLPIYGEMREWLLMAKEVRDLNLPDCPWVFHEKGRRIQTFRKAWSSVYDRAGVPGLLFLSEQDLLDAAAKMERRLQSLGTVLSTVEQKRGEAWGKTGRTLLN
jgi:integrase